MPVLDLFQMLYFLSYSFYDHKEFLTSSDL